MKALKVLSVGQHTAEMLREFVGQDVVILGGGDLAALRAAGGFLYQRVLLALAPVFPNVVTDTGGTDFSVAFNYANEIRVKVWGVAEIDADVFETGRGWQWSGRVTLIKWKARAPEMVVEDVTVGQLP